MHSLGNAIIANTTFILDPNTCYKNTLISTNSDRQIKNYASIKISQINNTHENYLIFGETTSSRHQSVSAHIFDGLGSIFTDSWTNHCAEQTSQGYANCKLIIQDQD